MFNLPAHFFLILSIFGTNPADVPTVLVGFKTDGTYSFEAGEDYWETFERFLDSAYYSALNGPDGRYLWRPEDSSVS